MIDHVPGHDDAENPRREIPSCSIGDCEKAAGAVVGGELYCAAHASEALERRIAMKTGRQEGPKETN